MLDSRSAKWGCCWTVVWRIFDVVWLFAYWICCLFGGPLKNAEFLTACILKYWTLQFDGGCIWICGVREWNRTRYFCLMWPSYKRDWYRSCRSSGESSICAYNIMWLIFCYASDAAHSARLTRLHWLEGCILHELESGKWLKLLSVAAGSGP